MRLCEAWQWGQANGALRDMVCRGMLLMLERIGEITLPPVKCVPHNPLARRTRPERMLRTLELLREGLVHIAAILRGNQGRYLPWCNAVFSLDMEIVEVLLQGSREVYSGFSDSRRSADGSYTMADIGLSAFSLFFMQSESFLSHQKRRLEGYGISNCQTLFGMEKIPTYNHIRTLLDAVSPEALQPCFDQILEQLRARNGLKAFQRLAGRTLVALDGTEYFCSQKLSCLQCLTRKRSNGKEEHYHAMLAATIGVPAHRSSSVGVNDRRARP